MRLLDPSGERSTILRPSAPRLVDLAERTIGLLDISKPRGDIFLDTLEGTLIERGATVERFRKPTFTKNAPEDLRARIAERCDAVIEALAD